MDRKKWCFQRKGMLEWESMGSNIIIEISEQQPQGKSFKKKTTFFPFLAISC